jgi:hypothetical protein
MFGFTSIVTRQRHFSRTTPDLCPFNYMKLIACAVALGFGGLCQVAVAQSDQNAASSKDSVNVPMDQLPDGTRPPQKILFPVIKDWNTLTMTLRRLGCYGTCPVYRLDIHGDGTVRYKGTRCVATTGERETHIPVDRVRRLYDAFLKAEFFWTFDNYKTIIDGGGDEVIIAFDDHKKSVWGMAMPIEIAQLKEAIDKAADVKQWVQSPTRARDCFLERNGLKEYFEKHPEEFKDFLKQY